MIDFIVGPNTCQKTFKVNMNRQIEIILLEYKIIKSCCGFHSNDDDDDNWLRYAANEIDKKIIKIDTKFFITNKIIDDVNDGDDDDEVLLSSLVSILFSDLNYVG